VTPKKAEQWRSQLETSISGMCGSATCLGRGKDGWGSYELTCPLWEAAAVLGLEVGRPEENLRRRLSSEGKEPLLFQ